MSKAELKKQHILRSANELLAKKGLMDITLDEVAAQAGLSKGGVTHYYPNKDLLLIELATMLDRDYLDKIETTAKKEEGCVGAWSRALIKVSDEDLTSDRAINNALVAAALASQKSDVATDSLEFMQKCAVNDGYDPVLGTIIRLAIDGLYYGELFKASSLEPKLRADLLERLISWTKETN